MKDSGCKFDPKTVTGPIGMFHCPECGEMQIAGLEHIKYMDDEEMDQYLKEFNKNLADSQEELPPEFAKVLKDNYWELISND